MRGADDPEGAVDQPRDGEGADRQVLRKGDVCRHLWPGLWLSRHYGRPRLHGRGDLCPFPGMRSECQWYGYGQWPELSHDVVHLESAGVPGRELRLGREQLCRRECDVVFGWPGDRDLRGR